MSDLFSMYEDKFNEVVTRIKQVTASFATLSRDKAEAALSSSVELFKEGEEVMKQMEIETSANGTLVSLNKVKQCKSEFGVLQVKFQKLQDKYITQKAESAIILGTEDDAYSDIKRKGSGLIANENGNDDKNDIVMVSNSFDKKKDDSDGKKDDSIEKDTQFLIFQKEKRNKRLMIIASIVIILILVLLIILLIILH